MAICSYQDSPPCRPHVVWVLCVHSSGTLKTVLAALENERPVIVVVSSGGAARDIYNYCVRGKLPNLDKKRPYVLKTAEELLPKIRQKGFGGDSETPVSREGVNISGVDNRHRISFFESETDLTGTAYLSHESQRFENLLLQAMLFDCQTKSEAIYHSVSWSQPRLLETFLAQSTLNASRVHGSATALQCALCIGGRTENARVRC